MAKTKRGNGGSGGGEKEIRERSCTKPMEPAACRETLHSMAVGPQLGVGERFLGYGGNVCKYTTQHSAHTARAEVCGTTFTSNHLRKVDQGRSVFDGNKRSVRSSQPDHSVSSFDNRYM